MYYKLYITYTGYVSGTFLHRDGLLQMWIWILALCHCSEDGFPQPTPNM